MCPIHNHPTDISTVGPIADGSTTTTTTTAVNLASKTGFGGPTNSPRCLRGSPRFVSSPRFLGSPRIRDSLQIHHTSINASSPRFLSSPRFQESPRFQGSPRLKDNRGEQVQGKDNSMLDESQQCECHLFGWDKPGHSPACDCWVVSC